MLYFNTTSFPLNTAGSLTKSKLCLSKTDWQKKLTPEQFHVTREKGTEAVSRVTHSVLVGFSQGGEAGVEVPANPQMCTVRIPSASSSLSVQDHQFPPAFSATHALQTPLPCPCWPGQHFQSTSLYLLFFLPAFSPSQRSLLRTKWTTLLPQLILTWKLTLTLRVNAQHLNTNLPLLKTILSAVVSTWTIASEAAMFPLAPALWPHCPHGKKMLCFLPLKAPFPAICPDN